MSKISLVFILVIVCLLACSKKKDSTPSADIKIISLTASANPVMAFDTTVITMEANGKNLQYAWVANHGKLKGSGKTVKYSACQSCIGHNTITCRLLNETGEVSDTVMIRVTEWHPKNKH